MGPFLYTSTQCSGAFLACVLGIDEADDDDVTVKPTTPTRTPEPLQTTTSETDEPSTDDERR